MRSRPCPWILAFGLSIALATGSQAAPPIGAFLGKVGGGNALSSAAPVTGWALHEDGIATVDILVDGLVSGRAVYGITKPQVSRAHPGFPDSGAPGFRFVLDTTRYTNGKHVVSAVATSSGGERRVLPGKQFTFYNAPAALLPFGRTEFPNPHAELVGDCSLTNTTRRYSVVQGYALDVGVQPRDTGVGFVELLIDRSLFANTKMNCADIPAAGGLSNCYGLRRTDIEGVYPTLKDSSHSGFRFVLDVGALLSSASGLYLPGHHTLTVRVGDLLGQTTNVAEIPVTFRCDEGLGNEGSIGFIDRPSPVYILAGTVTVNGWALDWEGVNRIQILVDNQFAGDAFHGFLLPLVTSAYPGYPESAAPGFQFQLDTTQYSDGVHQLQVLVIDDLGVVQMIGQRSFEVNNIDGQ